MKLHFEYNKEKDLWCLLTKGKTSINQPFPSKTYEELMQEYGENPTNEDISLFIDEYIKKHHYSPSDLIETSTKEWESVKDEFTRIAKNIFNVELTNNITSYITINNRLPYSFTENWFFISFRIHIFEKSCLPTIFHELWHFYTKERFGPTEDEIVWENKYNNVKEALTVLLNVECSHLWPVGVVDYGYPQHKELRNEILEWWNEKKDIEYVWNNAIKFIEPGSPHTRG